MLVTRVNDTLDPGSKQILQDYLNIALEVKICLIKVAGVWCQLSSLIILMNTANKGLCLVDSKEKITLVGDLSLVVKQDYETRGRET